jgi:hypothetical protein
MGMGKGGHMTISPPANVKTTQNEDFHVLTSGIDTLDLAIDVTWKDTQLFSFMEDLKKIAKEEDTELSSVIENADQTDEWKFVIKPYGAKGYSWLLIGHEFTLIIGNWIKPESRPSILVKISSETLWIQSPPRAVNRIVNLLRGNGASIVTIKPSRIDLCLDLMVPENLWTPEIMSYAVNRAKETGTYHHCKNLEGLRIGKGGILARIYDKVLEIKNQSKKFWMFEVWKLDQVPEGRKIIRIEFQLRREVIKSLGLNVIQDLFEDAPRAWAYCTQNWLKFQDRPGLHHTQRTTLPWWQAVQKGFLGVQDAEPLVREKASAGEIRQLALQTYGSLTSFVSAVLELRPSWGGKQLTLTDAFNMLALELISAGKDEDNLNGMVEFKRANYSRVKEKE